MKIYYSESSLIYKGFNRYWSENDAFHQYFVYKDIKKFKREHPIEFKNRSKYNILENKNLYTIMTNRMSLFQENSFSH